MSDDTYVKQQKEDIEELATMFKDMLGQQASTDDMPYIKELEAHFIPLREFKACYSFNIEGIKNPFMTGEMTAKGNFKTLRMLDQIFPF